MGCSGSKTAAKPSVPAATDTTEADFKIKLENPTCDADMGLVVQFPEKKYVLVESLKEEGLIPSWNKASENTPEMQVKAGDMIVMINDKFGDSDAMMAECKATSITLGVKRPSQVAAPATDAQAGEATMMAAPSAEAPTTETPTDALVAEAPVAEASAGEAQAAGAPTAEVAVAEAPAEPCTLVAEAPAGEAEAAPAPTAEPSTAVAETPVLSPAEEVPATEVPAAPATEPEVCLEDISVSVKPETTEVGAGAGVLQMCSCKWC